MNRVKDKVALVTGAENLDGETVGLGRAAALMLAREGSKVVATDIVKRAGDSVVDEILYLASDESSFVTGAELVIDGGFLAQ